MGQGGGVSGGGGNDVGGMASSIGNRAVLGNIDPNRSVSNMTSLSPNDVATGLAGTGVGGVRPGEGAPVPGSAGSAGMGTGGESGAPGSLVGPGSGQGMHLPQQQGKSRQIDRYRRVPQACSCS